MFEGFYTHRVFDTAEEAKACLDEMLIERGYVLCKDEDEFDKYRLLV